MSEKIKNSYADGPVVLTFEEYSKLHKVDRNTEAGRLALTNAGIDLNTDTAPVRLINPDGTEQTGMMDTNKDFGTFIEDPSNYGTEKWHNAS